MPTSSPIRDTAVRSPGAGARPPGSSAPDSLRWVVQVVALTLLASALFVSYNVHEDRLGLHGRNPVTIYALERFSKYLMSYRYVPDHYDGVLVSNSVAANWDTGLFHRDRVFNAGLRGSTIAEEKTIVDNAVARGHLRIAIIVLLPSLTGSHEMRTAYMTPHDLYASYGSVQTLILDAQAAMERFGPTLGLPASAAAHKFAADGAMFFPMTRETDPRIPPLDTAELNGDPAAVQQLRDMLTELHAHGVHVYGVFAPLYAPRWQMQGPELRAWQDRTRRLFADNDTMIDLNDAQLAPLEADRESFPDYLHLTRPAAQKVMSNLVHRIEDPGGNSGQGTKNAAVQSPVR